jgi:hypothetical protein
MSLYLGSVAVGFLRLNCSASSGSCAPKKLRSFFRKMRRQRCLGDLGGASTLDRSGVTACVNAASDEARTILSLGWKKQPGGALPRRLVFFTG